MIGRYLERSKYNAVLMDNVEGGREATNKLIEWGHRKIGIITGPIETHTFYDRLIGYQMALKENNIEVQEDLIAYGEDFRQQNGVQGVTTLLGKNKNVTAIFACDDFIALGALNKLHELGIRVPEDISLIGYTDLPIAVQTMPPLTTMKVDRVALGEMVARLALDIMAGKIVKPVHIKMFAEVIVRESVKNLNNQ
ncbi:MAG: substrate-binding domain-containing protein [Candidatus Atribacteria bacterium]|nr:substrate-binding domain-containing protein [Candidatus Atribacteria bacterium]